MRKYYCPKCKNETFEEVCVDTTVTYRVRNTESGFEYTGQSSAEGGYVACIQCQKCGYQIPSPDGHPVDMLDELAPALEELGAYRDE